MCRDNNGGGDDDDDKKKRKKNTNIYNLSSRPLDDLTCLGKGRADGGRLLVITHDCSEHHAPSHPTNLTGWGAALCRLTTRDIFCSCASNHVRGILRVVILLAYLV